MRIVYAALRHDYGNPERGPSFEEQAFLPALRYMGHEVVPFDYFAELLRLGYEGMNRSLVSLVREFEPELLFCVLFEEQLDRRTVAEITRHTSTTTFNWFCDDHWRFDSYSRHWAPSFDWVATTDETAYGSYKRLGIEHVLLTQWACNPHLFELPATAPDIDVSFVGQPHADRRRLIRAIEAEGIDVACWGHGWERGRLSPHKMTEVFARSRINLNFSKAAVDKRFGTRPRQLKARLFEIASSGGFVLTETAPGLERYFRPGEEVATFDGRRQLVRQVKRLLDHEELRTNIAMRGTRRARTEHTYAGRLTELFENMGLPVRLRRAA